MQSVVNMNVTATGRAVFRALQRQMLCVHAGCAFCVQDFGLEVLKTVNATDIADKLEKIHERNEKNHFHHHPHHHHHPPHFRHRVSPDGGPPDFEFGLEFDEDECITSKDLEDLKPDLESLVIPDWKDECKDICTPVLKAVPLAATTSGVLLFVGLISGICSLIPLCLLCCGCCKDEHPAVPPQWQPTYGAAPSATPVRPPAPLCLDPAVE